MLIVFFVPNLALVIPYHGGNSQNCLFLILFMVTYLVVKLLKSLLHIL